jgi:hypothetical protein
MKPPPAELVFWTFYIFISGLGILLLVFLADLIFYGFRF